jgi:hypothetical protein
VNPLKKPRKSLEISLKIKERKKKEKREKHEDILYKKSLL